MPPEVGKIEDIQLAGFDVRVFTPEGTAPEGGWPVFIYLHGGPLHSWMCEQLLNSRSRRLDPWQHYYRKRICRERVQACVVILAITGDARMIQRRLIYILCRRTVCRRLGQLPPRARRSVSCSCRRFRACTALGL